MMDWLWCFLIATVISFAGSVQFGPVNLKVIQAAYSYGLRSALIVAAGGLLPELVYSSIAVWCSWLLLSNPVVTDVLRLISFPFFLITGLLLINRKENALPVEKLRSHKLFLSGFLAGALNPMLFTFWFMIITFLVTGNHIELGNWPNRIAFILGTAVGAFLLLLLFAKLTIRNKNFLERKLSGRLNKIIGMIFIILSVYQFVSWIFD